MISLTKNNNIYLFQSQIQFENQFAVLGLLEFPLAARLRENPTDLYVVSVSAVCHNCPLRKTRLGCTNVADFVDNYPCLNATTLANSTATSCATPSTNSRV